MLPIATSLIREPVRKRVRATCALLATLATVSLLLVAPSSYAANPQPQSPQAHNVLDTFAATGTPGASGAPSATCPQDGQCFADVLPSNPFYAFVNRIYMQDLVAGYPCGGVGEP